MNDDSKHLSERSGRKPQGLTRWWHEVQPLTWIFIGVAAILYCLNVYPSLFGVLRSLHYNDFGKFYYGMQEWQNSGVLYGPNRATLIPFGPTRAEQFWNMNPPHFHFLMWPLVSFPIEQAFNLWTLVNVAALVFAIVATARAVPIKAAPTTWFGASALAIASAPALSWAVTGQLTGLLAGATTWIWLDLRRGRWVTAGLMIGLVTSIKPFLAPLGLYLVFRKQWRAVFVAAASLVAAYGLGLAVFGVQTHRDWLDALSDVRWTGAVMNASVYGLVGRTWSADIFVDGAPPRVLSGLLAVAILSAGVFTAWRARDTDRAVLILFATSLLVSPLGWVYYVPIMAGPLLALAASGRLAKWSLFAIPGFFIPNFVLWPFSSWVFAVTIGSAYTWSLLWLWFSVALTAEDVEPSAH